MQLRPSALALYSARSALFSSRSGLSPSAGASAIPMLTVATISCSLELHRRGQRGCEAVREFFRRRPCREHGICTTTNSSPPSRATTSSSRVTARRRSATVLSRKSPPSCPRRVVDLLEAVEVDEVHGEAAAADRQDWRSAFSNFSIRLGAIGQARSAHRDARESGCAGRRAAFPWSGDTTRSPECRRTIRSADRAIPPRSGTSVELVALVRLVDVGRHDGDRC